MRHPLLVRLLATFVAVFGLLALGVVLPSSASAIPFVDNCSDAPTPEVPGRGVEAFFAPAPAAPPPAADPFAPNATTSIHDQYGYAGLRWSTYDLGCTASPEAGVGTTVANWIFTLPKAVVAATGAMLTAAFEPTFLGVFDPLVTSVVESLRKSVFDQWAGLVLAGVGFLIVWRARRASLRGTAAAVGWAMIVMVLATALFRWPLLAGQAADATVTTTLSTVTSALDERTADGRTSTGSVAASNLHDALLYQVWLGGEFGDANSVTARKYGAQIFDTQALTWAQAATLAQDPAAGQQIIEGKKARFKALAAQIKSEDPDAYEYLVGKRTDTRIGFAALSLFAVACAVPFLLTAALLMIGALVITRFAVMLFPAVATLGIFPTMRRVVVGVGNTVGAALINAVVFGVGTAVMVKAYGVIMAPGAGLPAWLVVVLVLLLTVVMWATLRPFQRLTAMASPGRNHFADAAGALGVITRGLGRASGRIATTAAGVVVGDAVAKDKDRDPDERHRRRIEAEPQAGEDGTGTDDGTGGPRSERGVPVALPGGRSGGSGRGGPRGGSGSRGSGGSGGSRGSASSGFRPHSGPPLAESRGRTLSDGPLVAAEVATPARRGDRAGADRSDRSDRSGRGGRSGGDVVVRGRAGRERPRRSEVLEGGDDGWGAGGPDLTDDAYAVYRPGDDRG